MIRTFLSIAALLWVTQASAEKVEICQPIAGVATDLEAAQVAALVHEEQFGEQLEIRLTPEGIVLVRSCDKDKHD